MIENTLLYFKTKTAFNTLLEADNIKNNSIAFILDTKQIWTHGTYFDCDNSAGNIKVSDELAASAGVTDKNVEAMLSVLVVGYNWFYEQALPSKQDVIADLEEIRLGAAKGATALQSIPSEYVTETELSDKGYVTTTLMNTELEKKQDIISDLDDIRSGADLGATALQKEQYTGTITAENTDSVIDDPLLNSFEVLPNGNIKVTYDGVSSEFMVATPSGDPMHYIYVSVGAEYNDTGEDIIRTGIGGDEIIWKNAHWYLNELGDITSSEMRSIYLRSNITQAAKSVSNIMQGIGTRTNIATWTGTWNTKIMDSQIFGYCSNLKTARLRDSEHYLNTNTSWMFTSCANLEKIFPTLNATSTTSFNGAFDSCASLKEIRLKALGVNCSFARAQNLSNTSILYMINNSNAAKTITITLHAGAYDRAMADIDIVSALNEHTNVTLAKA